MRIKLIIYDFDGVMTDNKVYIDQNGNELVQVNRADGLAISEIIKLGIKQLIISTEKNPVVSARAKKLGIPCIQHIENKTNHDIKALEYFIKKKLAGLNKIENYLEYIHFCLTSQDINSVANVLRLKECINQIIVPYCQELLELLNTKGIDVKT